MKPNNLQQFQLVTTIQSFGGVSTEPPFLHMNDAIGLFKRGVTFMEGDGDDIGLGDGDYDDDDDYDYD